MRSDLVTRIAGESEENCALREHLNKKLHILTKGLETCKRFVGVRTFGKKALFNSVLYLLTWLVETGDTRAQAQNKLPASVNSQNARKHIGEPQGDGVESFTGPSQADPAESLDGDFESVARPSQSSFIEEDDNSCADPEPIAECEETMEPDIAPMKAQASSRKFKKNKKSRNTADAL